MCMTYSSSFHLHPILPFSYFLLFMSLPIYICHPLSFWYVVNFKRQLTLKRCRGLGGGERSWVDFVLRLRWKQEESIIKDIWKDITVAEKGTQDCEIVFYFKSIWFLSLVQRKLWSKNVHVYEDFALPKVRIMITRPEWGATEHQSIKNQRHSSKVKKSTWAATQSEM